jgi:hypothetical protein
MFFARNSHWRSEEIVAVTLSSSKGDMRKRMSAALTSSARALKILRDYLFGRPSHRSGRYQDFSPVERSWVISRRRRSPFDAAQGDIRV